MNSNNDDILGLTNEEVDDALNFGMTFDDNDLQNDLQDNTLPTLNSLVAGDQGSLGTCSPEPSFDDGSLTSTGSKRSRADLSQGDDDTEDEQSPKRRLPMNFSGWNASFTGGGRSNNTASAIRSDREREGRCPDCGLETHLIIRGDKGYEKTPLNVEGEVLHGRCLFCHPLEEGEKDTHGKTDKQKSKSGSAKKLAAGQKTPFQFDVDMTTPQQHNRKTPLKNSSRADKPRKTSTGKTQKGKSKDRKHSVKQHIKDNNRDPTDKIASQSTDDEESRASQYSNRSQVSDGIGRLGHAMASGMGMTCAETPTSSSRSNLMQRQNSKTPQGRDPPSSTKNAPGIANNNLFGGSDRFNDQDDIPAHIQLAHNKLPSSIYHHHLYPVSKEAEQAYIEKTLAYLESGGGDIVDLIVSMRRFPFSLSVQSLCCEKLYVHCFDNDHAHSIVLVGGIRTVIDAMENHSYDIALQRGCAGIIKHIAMAGNLSLNMLDKMGAVKVIINAMQQHKTSASLLESCCWALASMARGPNNEIKVRIAKMGGVHAAMNAVEHFPHNETLLRAAFHCLQQLGYNPSSYAAGQIPQQINFQSPQQQPNQQQQQQMQNLNQLDKVISHIEGSSPKPQNQMNQNEMQQMNMSQTQQSQLHRTMNQNAMRQRNEVQQMNEMRQMQMNQAQQQQFQRMMSQNSEMHQMQMNQSQQQNLFLNRQRQQMLAMAQAGGLPNEEMMMRLNMMNNMANTGSSQSILGPSDVQGQNKN